MKKNQCCCWDLEGPITIIDFAAELSKKLSEKSELNLRKYNMREFYTMISNYDDYIVDFPGVKEELRIPEYEPGDTLRLMSPLYISCFTDKDLVKLTRTNFGLLPGCVELINLLLKSWEIFVISTSYTQFAYNITDFLNIPRDQVYATDLNIKNLRGELENINDSIDLLIRKIFKKYLKNKRDLFSVIDDLNSFFWTKNQTDYLKVMNQIKVRGGKRKEAAIEEISRRTRIPISEMVALGDSITDINMLKRLKVSGGIAVSFNGNKFSINQANIALTTSNSLGALPIFQEKNNINSFLENWENKFNSFQNNPKKIPNTLASQECRNFFIKYNFVPEIINLTNKSETELKEIIAKQEVMRKTVRGWAGKLK